MGPELVPLSALNHLLFCPRRCALIHIERAFVENAFTLEGRALHERVDLPSAKEREGVRIERALPLFSDRLGLVGKSDVVEFHGERPIPVEYKRGRRRPWDNDEVQLCAQALCLEDMLGVAVPEGALYHAGSQRRRVVRFDAELRRQTEEAIAALHALLAAQRTPPAELKPRCSGCSLRPICLPELSLRLSGEVSWPKSD